MKRFLAVLLLFFSLSSSAQQIKQYIVYDVPIHLKANVDPDGAFVGTLSEFSNEYLDAMILSRFDNATRIDFVETIFDKVRSGEVTVYEFDMLTYKQTCTDPEECFQNSIPKDAIKEYMGMHHSIPVFDMETGGAKYDANGNQIFRDTIDPYTVDDVLALTFFEEWTIDEKTNILTKKVLGYAPCVAYYDSWSGNFYGIDRLFFIPCEEFKVKNKTLVKNFESSTQIVQSYYDEKSGDRFRDALTDVWWYEELLPDKRNRFVGANEFAPFLSSNRVLKFYDPWQSEKSPLDEFPYSFEIDYEAAVRASQIVNSFPAVDPNTGTFLYDDNGQPVYEESVEDYEVTDIKSLGFIEEWFFDEVTLSIQKDVKGISPIVDYVDSYSGEVIGVKSLYWLRYR